MWRPDRDAYFAGLTDGEGCFLLNLNVRPRGGRPAVVPRFTLNLRADDVAVLRQLHGIFGGRLTLSDRTQGAPRFFWHVGTKAGLSRLVRYFDAFPLHAKKRHDYAIWREAVLLYVAKGGPDSYEELLGLREALIAQRVYAGDLVELAEQATAESARGR